MLQPSTQGWLELDREAVVEDGDVRAGRVVERGVDPDFLSAHRCLSEVGLSGGGLGGWPGGRLAEGSGPANQSDSDSQ